jgi:WD40 repeat protein
LTNVVADDAVLIVWNLATGEKIQTFSSLFHGPVSAITWIALDSAEGSAFVFGCADGSLHLYKRTDKQVSELSFRMSSVFKQVQSLFSFVMVVKAFDGAVEGVAFDPHHRRLAGVGSACAKLWNITREGHS